MWRSQIKNVVTFLLGAGGFVHELFFVSAERPFILTACLALMGLPFVLGGDGKLRKNGDDK